MFGPKICQTMLPKSVVVLIVTSTISKISAIEFRPGGVWNIVSQQLCLGLFRDKHKNFMRPRRPIPLQQHKKCEKKGKGEQKRKEKEGRKNTWLSAVSTRGLHLPRTKLPVQRSIRFQSHKSENNQQQSGIQASLLTGNRYIVLNTYLRLGICYYHFLSSTKWSLQIVNS